MHEYGKSTLQFSSQPDQQANHLTCLGPCVFNCRCSAWCSAGHASTSRTSLVLAASAPGKPGHSIGESFLPTLAHPSLPSGQCPTTHTLSSWPKYIPTLEIFHAPHTFLFSCHSLVPKKRKKSHRWGAGREDGGGVQGSVKCSLKGPGLNGGSGKAENEGDTLYPTLHPFSLLGSASLSHHSGSCWPGARAGWDVRAAGRRAGRPTLASGFFSTPTRALGSQNTHPGNTQ